MIISTDAEKAQDKIKYPFNKNFQKEIGIKNSSNSIKSIYKNLIASILPSGEKPTAECIPNPKIRNKARMPALTQRRAGRSGCPSSLAAEWGINPERRGKTDLEGQPWKIFRNVVFANNRPHEKIQGVDAKRKTPVPGFSDSSCLLFLLCPLPRSPPLLLLTRVVLAETHSWRDMQRRNEYVEVQKKQVQSLGVVPSDRRGVNFPSPKCLFGTWIILS